MLELIVDFDQLDKCPAEIRAHVEAIRDHFCEPGENTNFIEFTISSMAALDEHECGEHLRALVKDALSDGSPSRISKNVVI